MATTGAIEVQKEVRGGPGRSLTLYRVGDWSFEEDDKDLKYIDQAIEAWTAWRAYVAAEQGA